MVFADKLIEKIKSLPEEKQVEVLDFVDFLQGKFEEEERREWSSFSLDSAMREIEDDNTLYFK
jgi:hypothetical protein